MGAERERRERDGAEVIPIAPDLTTRVGAILESVQREADRILDDARAEAEAGSPPAASPDTQAVRVRLLALSDELVGRAEGILAAASTEEADELGESFRRLAGALTRAADALTGEVEEALGEAAAAGAPGTRAHRAAVEMAALGCTRAQVEAHLRGYLAIANPSPVLDRIFGRSAGAGARVDWALPPAD